ncbi:MAG: circularly permuted type 2 ATP-grasp protein, partial [Acidobacteriota bacterium]
MAAPVPSSLSPSPFGALFTGYNLAGHYDEMFDPSGRPRAHCRPLFEDLRAASQADLAQRQMEADKAFLTQGITFTVYGDDQGTERIFPFDLLPRIITAAEWETLERGLAQRLTAINMFLKDVYHDGRILAEGVVPRDLVYSCRHYRREMRGVHLHRDIYVSVSGTDLIRLEDGRFVVLEDNLRVPSGVSYMLANREVTRRVFPGLFDRYHVAPIAQYGQALLATLRALAPPAVSDPTFVVLTPGVGNSAYFEHAFLAREMGVALVEGRDLLVHDNIVYMR